ncbi:alpha/beta-hydrolase [Mycena sp. CBHHK59/15]|nr:alpha/beta-hydrolase [Mycena sp. CBHHK59/15]
MRDWTLAFLSFLLLLFCSGSSAATRHTFTSTRTTDSGLTYVKNSGICETTAGIGQISGYINLAKNASMWFWFFEARNSPDTAPLTLWINGGPGCSSMIGLFQETGPCQVNPDSKSTTLNPYSWNNISNMIYIDQPIGAGFSTGTATVNSTDDAAPMIWAAFQILFESPEFSAFQGRQLIFATESYGAHMAPVFIAYFNSQNALIDSGKLTGQKIGFTQLMISDGKHDPLIQYASYITFAADAPGYGPLQNASVISSMSEAFTEKNGCQDQLEACYAAGTTHADDDLCAAADDLCTQGVFFPATRGRDADDLRQFANTTDPFPFSYYIDYIQSKSVMDAIGATSQYDACNADIKAGFGSTGEFGRTALPPLAALANAKFPILIWVGDADIKANWLGVHEAMVSMNWYGNETLNNTALTNMTIDGTPVASIKAVDSFTFRYFTAPILAAPLTASPSRVFGAGHNLPAYVPKTAFTFFSQVVQKQQIHSVASSSATTPAASPSASAHSGNSLPATIPWWWCWAVVALGLVPHH